MLFATSLLFIPMGSVQIHKYKYTCTYTHTGWQTTWPDWHKSRFTPWIYVLTSSWNYYYCYCWFVVFVVVIIVHRPLVMPYFQCVSWGMYCSSVGSDLLLGSWFDGLFRCCCCCCCSCSCSWVTVLLVRLFSGAIICLFRVRL